MRAIHFCFQLHETYRLAATDKGYFSDENDFRELDAEAYQPLFALLERNIQKYKRFKFSLLVSGPWLEMAEKYDPELVRRLAKMVKTGQVEMIVTPYYYSTASFYDWDELGDQVELYREKLEQLFGISGRIFALPEFLYSDAIASWAEKNGFAGMLAGSAAEVLDWRSANHVYEVTECEYLRVLYQNRHLSQLLTENWSELLVEQKVEEDGQEKLRKVISEKKFQKRLELDMLRGALVNLYFDARILQKLHDVGVIRFFDRLIGDWLGISGNCMVGAAEACMLEEPSESLSVPVTVSWREEKSDHVRRSEELRPQFEGFLPVRVNELMKLPSWLSAEPQKLAASELYRLRREVLASEDQKLIADFRRLTALDYQEAMEQPGLKMWRDILLDLKKRANEAKKSQAVEISRTYTKKRDRGVTDNSVAVNFIRRPVAKTGVNEVKVNFGTRGGVVGSSVHAAQARPVSVGAQHASRLSNMHVMAKAELGEVVDIPRNDGVEIQLPGEAMPRRTEANTPKKAMARTAEKSRGARRRVIKRLVIE